jgi:hypothetical protein
VRKLKGKRGGVHKGLLFFENMVGGGGKKRAKKK